VDGEQAVPRQQPGEGIAQTGSGIGKEVALRMAKIEVLHRLQQGEIALLNEIGQGEAVEEGLLLFRLANDAMQTPFNQALFGRACLFGGKQALRGQAQAREQSRFLLSREARQGAEVGKVGL